VWATTVRCKAAPASDAPATTAWGTANALTENQLVDCCVNKLDDGDLDLEEGGSGPDVD
jgi:hypothetical protein